jgi:ferredoxin
VTPQICIAFCSPAGSTRHVAETIESTCSEFSADVHLLDLGQGKDRTEFSKLLDGAGPGDCFFMGSPVYRDMAVPPVMEFIDSLPAVNGCNTVPFVTWGGAFSGIALWQMGRELVRKGFNLMGGAKVIGTHSMMWTHPEPAGQGHPAPADDQVISQFARDICNRLLNNEVGSLTLDSLDYNASEHTAEIKEKLGQPWMIIPKTVDEDACTQCGVCEEVCPVAAVEMKDYPAFTQDCFDCFNCIRLCPEEAITPAVPLEKIHAMIRNRVKTFNERPHTQVF